MYVWLLVFFQTVHLATMGPAPSIEECQKAVVAMVEVCETDPSGRANGIACDEFSYECRKADTPPLPENPEIVRP